ncbi:MAG: DNA-directed RNA polymerase subunit beta, partial [Candidatus Berkelbacteria bacterium]|nr:DNA-directed RNA polymerase subunit beta [Candidatus Berkelbacteria bacterium]
LKNVISVKIDRKRRIPVTTFLRALGIGSDDEIKSLFADVDSDDENKYIESTLKKDSAKNVDEGLIETYKKIRPGDLATLESAKSFIEAMFFNIKRYDIGRVGRYKMNMRLKLETKNIPENRVLLKEDFINIVREIIELNNDPQALPDDTDSLKNRRIRAVGELLQGRVRVGLLRVERIVRDRMSIAEPADATPVQMINSRPIVASLQEFFASSQLSQFMNQTNPLSELEHKRTLSATGPGGLSRERAGFEVRDVHVTHYGRICPIETPEGPNIGLVGYLASYAKINEFGFIETPYRKVIRVGNKSRVTDDVVYLDASQEEDTVIAPASVEIDEKGYIKDKRVIVRHAGEPTIDEAINVHFMDVSPKQIISVTAALIPFIEHDDAARALMGANMQRQAVPLVAPESPTIGTGMELAAARDSGQIVLAVADGEVTHVSSFLIRVKEKNNKQREYFLSKFVRSNQGTVINHLPRVVVGDKVQAGDLLADGSATENGEIALGRNLRVAFMSWGGGNFEDAIIISDRLVKEHILSSIHIEKYSIEVRDTKLGPEVLTRDIPNVSEEALSNLDENGIIRVGAETTAGDILVGKISPKGETELSAEEKLLRAIFGEKAKDVRDSSLRLPHGERGKVVDVKIFSRESGDELPAGVYQLVEVSIAQLRKISVGDKLAGRHGNKGVISTILPEEDMPFMPDGKPVDIILNPLGVPSRMNIGQLFETHLGWAIEKNGQKMASPSLDGVKLDDIRLELKKSGLPEDGKIQLHDGRTGQPYDHRTVVGTIYMMKLFHLVDDKMHARSIGPYSMITQQPLGGKAQFGGQRFGEMEVWAIEAYGASNILQELLTIKSDDVVGRSKAYESIIKGEKIQNPNVPEAFNLLIKELQSLGLKVELQADKNLAIKPEEADEITVETAPEEKSELDEEIDEKLTELAAEQISEEEDLISEEVVE